MAEQLPLRLRLEEHARLDDYVGEAGHRLQSLDGIVLLTGMPGSGKSHLLQGLCHLALASNEAFIFLSNLSELDARVLQGLDNQSLVCLDNVDEIIEQAAWQEALFHLINGIRDRGGRLVLSSTRTVAELNPSLQDLASRLKGAYLVATDELDDLAKLEVIRRKAHRLGFEMSEDVCRFILSRSQRDMHHLARLVEQLDRETLMQQKKVTIPFVKSALDL